MVILAWGFPQFSNWQTVQILLFYLVFPPLATIVICGITGWLLPHVRWWVGLFLGL